MLNITNHQGDANQNHSEIPLHAHWDGYYKKTKTKQKWGIRDEGEKRIIR